MMSTSQSLLQPSISLPAAFRCQSRPGIRVRYVQVRAEVKRSFNEDKGKVSSADEKKPLYADEAPRVAKNTMSTEQQKKLRDEYLGLGGSPNSPIPNYFLYVIIGISFLAVLSWLSGAV